MINTLALRTSINDDPTFEHLLKGVSKGVVDAFAHADAPFAQVVQALKQPRSASFTPVYQVGRH
jgi:non-ribosomal peptide synthetase component F